MRQTKVCSNRVFVLEVHASPRRSEMDKEKEKEEEEEEEEEEKKTTRT